MITDYTRAAIVRVALADAPLTLHKLARRSGVRYPVLRAWRRSEATPGHDDAARLAHTIEQHAARLQQLAHALREAAR